MCKFIIPKGTTREEILIKMIKWVEVKLNPELENYDLEVRIIDIKNKNIEIVEASEDEDRKQVLP